jgi:histidine phosphotransferase ChpT
MPAFSLDPLDLAALLCSRVCHDVISPVGAIVNGLEVLDEAKDSETRGFAIDLIKSSAKKASARLQFCRLAFGAAGSSGASIDTGDAEQVARNLFADDRTRFDWHAARLLLPKNKVKLVLNMCLIAAAAIPRGGVLSVEMGADGSTLDVSAKGTNAKVAAHVPGLLSGSPEAGTIDAHGIQAYYTSLVATACDMALDLASAPDHVTLRATMKAAAPMEPESATAA